MLKCSSGSAHVEERCIRHGQSIMDKLRHQIGPLGSCQASLQRMSSFGCTSVHVSDILALVRRRYRLSSH